MVFIYPLHDVGSPLVRVKCGQILPLLGDVSIRCKEQEGDVDAFQGLFRGCYPIPVHDRLRGRFQTELYSGYKVSMAPHVNDIHSEDVMGFDQLLELGYNVL